MSDTEAVEVDPDAPQKCPKRDRLPLSRSDAAALASQTNIKAFEEGRDVQYEPYLCRNCGGYHTWDFRKALPA